MDDCTQRGAHALGLTTGGGVARKYTPAIRASAHDDIDAGILLKHIAKRRKIPLGTLKRWKSEGRPPGDEFRTVSEPADDAGSSGPVAKGRPGSEPGEPSRVRLRHDDLDEMAAPLARQGALKLLRYLAGESDEVLESSPLPRDVWEGLSDEAKRALADRAWNPRDARSAAHALASLVDKIPDILSIHERTRTSGESGVAGPGSIAGDDAVARMEAALRRRGPADPD